MAAQDFIQDFKKKTDFDLKSMEARKIVSQFNDQYEKAYQIFNPFYAEAYKDLSFYLGNQWSLEEKNYLQQERRNIYTYNKVKRIIDVVDGYQRKNRLATVIKPQENSDVNTADLFSDVMSYVMNKADGYEKISDSFKGSLTTGMSLMSAEVDYSDDPVNGDIKFQVDPWNAFILDPFITKRDLSDCGFVAKRRWLTKDEVKQILPNKSEEIDKLQGGTKDNKFQYMPYARQASQENLLDYTEYWRATTKQKKLWVDRENGSWGEWKKDDLRLALFIRNNPQIKIITKPVKSVALGIIVEGELLYYGDDPNGIDEYPFVPFFSVFEPSYDLFDWKFQSVTRVIRDSQTSLNKRRCKTVDMIDAQLNSGWLAKKDAVSNTKALYQTGQGKVVFLNPNAQMTDVQRLNPPDIPNGWMQLEDQFNKDIMEDAGINSEMFGQSDSGDVQTAAMLAKQRQSAGLVNLQGLFDGLRLSQKLLGRKTLKMIQNNYSPEKIYKITGKQPTPEFFDKNFGKYDAVVAEGDLTDSQKEASFMKYLSLKQMGIPVPDSFIVKSSNLQDSNELSNYMQQQADSQAQAAQMQQQISMQEIEARARALNAQSVANEGLGAERLSRIEENKELAVERKAKAIEDLSDARLNRVKTLKELQEIDINQVEKLILLAKRLQEETNVGQEALEEVE